MSKLGDICYIDHSTGEHDHMNAHIRTTKCPEARPVNEKPDTDMREVRGSRSFRENLAREKGYDE
jgi:hypothetical protein